MVEARTCLLIADLEDPTSLRHLDLLIEIFSKEFSLALGYGQ